MKPVTCRKACSKTKKRKRDSTNLDRDIMMWKTEVERQRDLTTPKYEDGDILVQNMAAMPPCSENCTFQKISHQPDTYVCHAHYRVHKCGESCCRKVQSRENWTCPWTKNVLNISLIAEEKTSSANCGRHQNGESYSKRGYGDEASDKSQKKQKRVCDAMEEAARVCTPALEAEGIKISDYQKVLIDYFTCISYHTDMFGGSRVLTKKAVVQFGLACSYMQRNGYSTPNPKRNGEMKHFFEKRPHFEHNLPKTHALIQMGYKVRAVTRTQDLLRRYLTEALVKAPDLNLTFILPT